MWSSCYHHRDYYTPAVNTASADGHRQTICYTSSRRCRATGASREGHSASDFRQEVATSASQTASDAAGIAQATGYAGRRQAFRVTLRELSVETLAVL